MFNKLSLSIGVGFATFSLSVMAQSAQAALFNFSYTLQNGDILSGMLEGEVQPDNDTVIVSGITMPMFNGTPTDNITFIDSVSNLMMGDNWPAIVSFSGTPTQMDLVACSNEDCDDGFMFDGLGIFNGTPSYSGYLSYGERDEAFIQANWSLTPKQTVPEPSSLIGLALIGGGLWGRKLILKNQ